MSSTSRSSAPNIVGEPPSPEFSDVLKRLHFNPDEALIWLEDRRMVLMHAESIGALRQELIESLGVEAARGLLTRFGYSAGCRDAELALKMRDRTAATYELLVTGAQFHALQGIVKVEISLANIDVERGICNLDFFWKNCFEDNVHAQTYGLGGEAVCWMEVGYASGFLSTCMGKRILVREVECRAMGEDYCRCLAKPLEEWADPELDLHYFEPGPVRLIQKAVLPPAPAPDAVLVSAADTNPPGDSSVIGASIAFNTIMHKIRRVAPTTATVLLLGESGVGKSAFAREIRRRSKRNSTPFLEVNCAAIPDQLMEAELFGVERGAYTGAGESRLGRFQLADKGTLFLDEIGTLSMTAQGKLLRVIQTGEFETLGGTTTRKVDVRLIAATNEDLWAAVREGRFREDLFYRLNVFPIHIPPLRERRDDIPLLLEHLIRKYRTLHERNVSGVTSRALQVILNYRWPGNIRELENVIERGVILGEDDQPLGYHQLFSIDSSVHAGGPMILNELGVLTAQEMNEGNAEISGRPLLDRDALASWAESIVERSTTSLDEIENTLVRAAVKIAKGNLTHAANLLGITRSQLSYRAKKLKISVPSAGSDPFDSSN